MKFFVRTLGCKMNQLDAARLGAALEAAGHRGVAGAGQADLVVVATCAVTAESERKSRQAGRALAGAGRRVALVGCGPRAAPGRWGEAGQDTLVFPRWEDLAAHFGADPEAPVFPRLGRTRVPVAIQTGCDDVCAFCITRVARGRHHSRAAEAVAAEVQEAEARGVREVVLTGINLAAWGAGDTRRPREARLHELLGEILTRTRIPRIRLSSLGPQYLHDGFFELLAEPRLCDHLHLSVQSGAPGVLARMARGHDDRAVRRVAAAARRARSRVALAADLIAGFPGESEAEHRQTRALIEEVGFAKVHVFPFSPREGTPAATLPDQLPPALRKARAQALREDGRRLRARFLAGQIGHTGEVLVEGSGSGLTTNYIRLATGAAAENAIVRLVIGPDTLAENPGTGESKADPAPAGGPLGDGGGGALP